MDFILVKFSAITNRLLLARKIVSNICLMYYRLSLVYECFAYNNTLYSSI